MASTFVIGIGGTGIKTLLHLKKMLMDQSPTGNLPPNFKLLGMDTCTTQDNVPGVSTEIDDEIGTVSAQAKFQNLNYTGKVSLATNEYIFIGGNTERFVFGDNNNTPTISRDSEAFRWFNKEFFERMSDRSINMNLTVGAGQYRQLGRLAWFYNLQMGIQSNLFSTINSIISNFPDMEIQVVVIGSLAGGTGSSVFMDVPHLIQQIGNPIGKRIAIAGLFALPDAFKWTPPVVVSKDMKIRAFAGLREISRFLTFSKNGTVGPRILYGDAFRGNPFLGNRLTSTYQLVYLFDERWTPPGAPATPNPLDVRIEEGVAPTMAYWASAIADPNAYRQLNAWFANRNNIISSMASAGSVPAKVGSVGTYSVVLPSAAIIEEWTTRLTQEVVDYLLPCDKDGKIICNQIGTDFQSTGSVVARASLPQHALPTLKDFATIGNYKPDNKSGENQPILKQILDRSVKAWQTVLVEAEANNEEYETTMSEGRFYNQKGSGFLNLDHFTGTLVVAPYLAKLYDNSALLAAEALIRDCDNEENRLRIGWKAYLNNRVINHVSAYRDELLMEVKKWLTGGGVISAQNAIQNRAGRLAYMLDYVDFRKKQTNNALLAIKEARIQKENGIRTTRENLKTNGGPLVTAMKADVHKQSDYLKSREDLLEFYRWDAQAAAAEEIALLVSEYTALMHQELLEFVQTLKTWSTREYNLSAQLKKQVETIKGNRKTAKNLFSKVREYLDEPVWENQQYSDYTAADPNNPASGTAASRVLCDLEWNVIEVTKSKKIDDKPVMFQAPKLTLKFNEQKFPIGSGDLASSEIVKAEANIEDVDRLAVLGTDMKRMFARCRSEFTGAWSRLDVLKCLGWKYNSQTTALTPQAFGEKLNQMCTVLLKLDDANTGHKVVYLMTKEPSAGSNEAKWLVSLQEHLVLSLAADMTFSRFLPTIDSTTLTFLTLADLIDIETLPSFRAARTDYANLPSAVQSGAGMSRQILHAFSAEKNALIYDKINPDGSVVQVLPRVTGVFEDHQKLDLFLECLIFELIKKEPVYRDQRTVGHSWEVVLPPQPEQQGVFQDQVEDNIWFLTDPTDFSTDLVYYLPAAEIFCQSDLDKSQSPQSFYEASKPMFTWITGDPNTNRTGELKMKMESILDQRLPEWEQLHGQGQLMGINKIAAYALGLPEGAAARESALRIAVRLEALRKMTDKLNQHLVQIGKLLAPAAGGKEPSTWSMREVEKQFVEILIKKLEESAIKDQEGIVR